MNIQIKSPKQSLQGSYLKTIVDEDVFVNFRDKLKILYEKIDESNEKGQTEKHQETLFQNFLNGVYYEGRNYINSKSYKGLNECDTVIHLGKEINSPVRVLFELKTRKNINDMITTTNILKKGMFELVLYYLWEKVEHKNDFVSNLVITNFYDWFIFDSKEFERFFNKPKLKKYFEEWRKGSTDSDKTEQMYNYIKNYIESLTDEISCTFFNIEDFRKKIDSEDENDIESLVVLYKLFSPRHLLSEKDTLDSNSLNKDFYNELLYIIGVEEVKDNGKVIIRRKEEKQPGSLIESTIGIIQSEGLIDNIENRLTYGVNYEDQLFNVSLELCITWVNRIIFLKLLETQLLNYHNGNNDYSFIGSDKITSFQQLNQLFFEVLSERIKNRNTDLNRKFQNRIITENIPYLNSSLFEPTQIEKKTLRISGLDEEIGIELFSKSIILKKDKSLKGKRISTIVYLLKFLESYDFGIIKGQKLIKSSSEKTIINSSVLGLIFEKINGYKDGSVFTPSFITEEMTKESMERLILKKFNQKYTWDCKDYIELYNHLEKSKIQEYNDLINSLTICDPSVGSGHYLVSVLNEVIRIKSSLGILTDVDGVLLKDIEVDVENDELVVRYDDGNVFEYNLIDKGKIYTNKQRIQETIFNEKRSIIENSLFGVDINPNSVQICRLRLWIELLKFSFYTKDSNYTELQTLPNIDINIKQGNSLLQKFNFDENLSNLFKGKYKVKDYKEKVFTYKETNDKSVKRDIQQYILNLKKDIKSGVPRKLQTEYDNLSSKFNDYKISLDNMKLFGEKVTKEEKQKLIELKQEVDKKQLQVDEIKNNVHYEDSFEWRFEFPELLNDKGEFDGFDLIIGNPPYVVVKKEDFLSDKYSWNSDLYLMFFELSIKNLVKDGGFLSFITPRFYMVNKNCPDIRKSFIDDYHLYKLIETNPFEEVNTECVITYLEKEKQKLDSIPIYQEENKIFSKINDLEKYLIRKRDLFTYITFLTKEIDDVLDLIEIETVPLDQIYVESIRGVEVGKKDLRIPSGSECLIGEDMGRYFIEYQDTHISQNHKEYIRLQKFFGLTNMLYLRRVSKDLKSTVPSKNYSFNKNIYGISLQSGYSNYFVCGLLNSDLMNFYYKFKFSSKKEELFPEVQKYLYQQLPIKKTNKDDQREIIEVVKVLHKNPDNVEKIKELNELVYKLYKLNKNDISLIKSLLG